MKRQTIVEISVFALIVALGFAARMILRDLPNFAPVAAIALFAGYYFRSRTLALCAPLAVMLSSDLIIGGYDWHVMIAVYAMLCLPVVFRGVLQKSFRLQGNSRGARLASVAGLLGCTLAGSILFFLVTNFACWFSLDYSLTLSGLLECYTAAIPFFRYTMAGDMAFAIVFFGSYALAMTFAAERETCPVGA